MKTGTILLTFILTLYIFFKKPEMKKNITLLFSGIFFIICLISCAQNFEDHSKNLFPIKADSSVSIVMSGELESVNSTGIKSPSNWNLQYQIIYLPEEGTFVNEGDTVVIFDTKQVESQLLESRKKLEKYQQELKEILLKNRQEVKERENGISSLKIQKKIVLNQLEMSKYNSDTEQKNAELELEKTKINLNKSEEDLNAQYILNKNSENEVLLKIKQTEIEVERNLNMLKDMYLTTPKSGLVVYQRQGWRRDDDKVKEGDTVHPMSQLLAIPDLNNMRTVVLLNEVDLNLVEVGIPAIITIEAYPDTQFTGEVSYMSRIADREPYAEQLKSYSVYVNINSNENFRLKPGLSAKVEIFTRNFNSVFKIPSWCLFLENDHEYVLTENEDKIPVQIEYLQDGNAIVTGDLSTEIKIYSNSKIPEL